MHITAVIVNLILWFKIDFQGWPALGKGLSPNFTFNIKRIIKWIIPPEIVFLVISVGIEVHGEGSYRIETSPLITIYMIGTSIIKELILKPKFEDDP